MRFRTPTEIDALKRRINNWDKLSYEEQQRRAAVWRHNALTGHIGMAKAGMKAVLSSRTATDEAKDIANEIFGLLDKLDANIRSVRK